MKRFLSSIRKQDSLVILSLVAQKIVDSPCFWIFPVDVFGKVTTTSTQCGLAKPANITRIADQPRCVEPASAHSVYNHSPGNLLLLNSFNSFSNSSFFPSHLSLQLSRRITYAIARSPYSSCGLATTATSRMSGCSKRALSIAREDAFSPPTRPKSVSLAQCAWD